MTGKSSKHLLDQIDAAIRQGKLDVAIHALMEIKTKTLARSSYARFAALSRRSGISRLGARLLSPIVRAKKGGGPPPATSEERAEYAACLARIGVVPESLKILESIPVAEAPQALLFRGQALIQEWRYADAIPVLDEYLALRAADSYTRLVAQVNLAAALVSSRVPERAENVLNEVIAAAGSARAIRLLGNAFEIRAQLMIQVRRLDAAREALSESARHLSGAGVWDQLIVEKWNAVCSLLAAAPRSIPHAAAVARCRELRATAFSRGQWETARDLDRNLGLQGESRAHLLHFYFGTPFDDFRERVRSDLGSREDVPNRHQWIPGAEPGSFAAVSTTVDLVTGLGSRPGKVLDHLIRVLASDFYQPFSTGKLFSELFPDEYFNPFSSPHRIYELVRRLREWLDEQGFPLTIAQDRGTYRIASKSHDIGILLEAGLKSESREKIALSTLRDKFGQELFSSAEVAEVLGISPRSARRLLADREFLTAVEWFGRRKARRYRFKLEDQRRDDVSHAA